MQMDISMFAVCADGYRRCGKLVNAHGVSERAGEEIVISLRQLREDRCEGGFLLLGQVQDGGNVPAIRGDCFWDQMRVFSHDD